MKRYIVLALAIVFFLSMISISVDLANAEDRILETTIDSMAVAKTVNGNDYVRFIITEDRTLDGVAYKKSLPVMSFGALVEPAKAYKPGDPLKCIANFRRLDDGRESYTVLSFQ